MTSVTTAVHRAVMKITAKGMFEIMERPEETAPSEAVEQPEDMGRSEQIAMIQKAITEQVTRDKHGDHYKPGDYYIVVGPPLGSLDPQRPEATENTEATDCPPATRMNRPMSEQQRRRRIGEWRKVVRKNRETIRALSRGKKIADDDASTEAALRAYHATAAAKAETARADFRRRSEEWLQNMGRPERREFAPDMTARFSPAAYSCPLLTACHRWYRAQYEVSEVAKLIDKAGTGKWVKALERAHHLNQRLLCADAAWLTFVALHQEAAKPGGRLGPEAPEDWLVAWAAETVGGAFLLPPMKRADPKASGESLRAVLLDEIWVSALTLCGGGLSVRDFCRMPQQAATKVRSGYTNTTDEVNRLIPDTRNTLEDKHRPEADESDPEVIVMERATAALIQSAIQGLPPRQRRVMELQAEGLKRQEIAAAMDIEDESVKTNLAYVYKRLRSELGEMIKDDGDVA